METRDWKWQARPDSFSSYDINTTPGDFVARQAPESTPVDPKPLAPEN
jgi:hypothetical protein